MMVTKLDNENIIKRVYSSLKELVITCAFPPGERLNIEELAEKLRVSTTPVRESLNRLVAEDLILMIPRMGFFMKSLLESEIRDLYELNHVLLDWSLVNIAKARREGPEVGFPEIAFLISKLTQAEIPSSQHLVKSYSRLFAHIARQSGNGEISMRVQNINDRLHYIRLCECEMHYTQVDRVVALCRLYHDFCYEELRHALSMHHENRLKLLPTIIRAKNFAAPEDF